MADWPIIDCRNASGSGDENQNPFNTMTIQNLLRFAAVGDLGRNLKADGSYAEDCDHESKTTAAVKEFQRFVGFHGADVDGSVGPKTWGEMIEGDTITCFPKEHDRGDCVKAAQAQLIKNGALKSNGTSAMNGKFDDTTKMAVQDFQRDHGLRETGQVDRQTWKALIQRDNPG